MINSKLRMEHHLLKLSACQTKDVNIITKEKENNASVLQNQSISSTKVEDKDKKQ